MKEICWETQRLADFNSCYVKGQVHIILALYYHSHSISKQQAESELFNQKSNFDVNCSECYIRRDITRGINDLKKLYDRK